MTSLFSSSLMPCLWDLLLALGLGFAIGLERELVKKEVGLRTFSLVSLGSALFCLLVRVGINDYSYLTGVDPFRVLGQICVGIGFLGAGVIIYREKEGYLSGLTTAADIWVTAAIGAAVGLGYYFLAIFTTVLVLALLTLTPSLKEELRERRNKESLKNDKEVKG